MERETGRYRERVWITATALLRSNPFVFSSSTLQTNKRELHNWKDVIHKYSPLDHFALCFPHIFYVSAGSLRDTTIF